MIFKFSNIIGILLTIFVISIILHPFYKQNIEKFETSQLKTIYDTILETRLEANNYLDRIKALRDNLNQNGTVSLDNYTKLINDINNEFYERTKDKDTNGILEIKNQLNNDKINDLINKINDLNSKFSTLITPSANSSNLNLINSIRSLETGINLNVKHLNISDYNNDPAIYQPKIMIFFNNGCLTYINGIIVRDKKYNSKHCEMTNKYQYFIFKKITNGTDLENHLTGDYLELQKNINLISTSNNNLISQNNLYPFNIIHPIDEPTKCVKVALDGISIEDCKPTTLNMDQRWLNSHITKKSCI